VKRAPDAPAVGGGSGSAKAGRGERATIAAQLRRVSRLWPVPVALAAGAAFWLGLQWGEGALDGRGREVDRQIETYRSAIETGRRQRPERTRVNADLDRMAARTLGNSLEQVDSAVRARLNRIGEEVGLEALVVSTGAPVTRGTPARSEFTRAANQRALRDEIDFVEVPASLAGQGSLETLLRAVHEIEGAAWLKRIDSMRIDLGNDPARMRLDLRLTTLFLPGATVPEDLEVEPGPERPFDRYASLLAANPFLLPPPPPPPEPPQRPRRRPDPPPPPPPPAGFPYGEWMLTGVIEGPIGGEAWLAHRSNRERVALRPEERLGDAELVVIRADRVEFRLGEERFAVLVGGTLAERTPLPAEIP